MEREIIVFFSTFMGAYAPGTSIVIARDLIFILAAAAVVAFGVWVPRSAWLRHGAAFVATVIIAYGCSAILKEIIDRPRPFVGVESQPLIPKGVDDPSFPSGHATAAFALVFPLLALVPRWVRVALLSGAVLVAVGRVAIGVHYVTDVIAGALLAWIVWRGVHHFFLRTKKVPAVGAGTDVHAAS